MQRRSFFGSLFAAAAGLAASAQAQPVPAVPVPPPRKPVKFDIWLNKPAPHTPITLAEAKARVEEVQRMHTHDVTDPGHLHSYNHDQLDPSHSHPVSDFDLVNEDWNAQRPKNIPIIYGVDDRGYIHPFAGALPPGFRKMRNWPGV